MERKIILYSTETCPRCKVLVTKLMERNIDFEINTDSEYIESLGITFLPVLEVDGERMEFANANKWINSQEVYLG